MADAPFTTNVPPLQWTDQGVVIPPESDILNGRLADIATVANLNPSKVTAQGQLASSETACIGQANSTFLFYSTQVDPAFATGRMQDGIGNIYDLQRLPAVATSVECQCMGTAGVPIPQGASAQDTAGNKYICVQAGNIGDNGTVLLNFQNVVPGPIPCPAGTLNEIYQSIPGWDAVINPNDGVIGRNVETRSQFEFRRQASVAWQALGPIPAIEGAIRRVPGVISAYVTDNDLPISQVVGGVLINPNSLYVCVAGGAATDVAQAIWKKKIPGCGYNGTTTVVVEDTSNGYVPPYPSYNVSFSYATPLPVVVFVTLASSAQVPSTALTNIQNAVVAAFSGSDGGSPAAGIGQPLFASRFYPSISAPKIQGQTNPFYCPWATIVDIFLGSPLAASSFFTGSVSGSTLTVTQMTSGVISAGQVLIDTTGNIPGGITILNAIAATGGVGTYAISNTINTVSSELIYGITPAAFSIQPSIGQIPVISQPNVFLFLQ